MALSDPLGDMLTRIRNGQRAGQAVVNSPASKLRANVLEVLKREGYIRDYQMHERDGGKNELAIELKYYEGEGVIRTIQRISKPGRRVYSGVSDLKPHRSGLGISILSTPSGVLSDHEARSQNVGGEVLCQIF